MVFGKRESEVLIQGDIKSNGVSIDNSNIDFIVTILSTNLYSKPIESFLRETVSNAWDSHVEAGVNDPVIVELGKSSDGQHFCRIQDFGVGLSEERFNNIYRNIGSSTKRGTNGQIGGFGLGRFSALSCSDTVHITSVYEGNKYVYIMYKDGNSISIDLISKIPTEERNGVEVKIPFEDTKLRDYWSAIKSQLTYFDNIYLVCDIENNKYAQVFNNAKIKRFNTFSVSNLVKRSSNILPSTHSSTSNSYTVGTRILLGKVPYLLRLDNLTKAYPSYFNTSSLAVHFDIGDIGVVPNREELLYTAASIKTIEDKLDKVQEEIDNLIKIQENKDYDDLRDYLKAVENRKTLILLEGEYKDNVILIYDESNSNISLKGKVYDITLLKRVYGIFTSYRNTLPRFHGVTYELKSNSIRSTDSILSVVNIRNSPGHYKICKMSSLSNITKSWIRDTMSSGTIFFSPYPIKSIYKRLLNSNYDSYYYNSVKKTKYKDLDLKTVRVVFNYFLEKVSKCEIITNKSVPQSYIDDYKQAQKDKRLKNKKSKDFWDQTVLVYKLRINERTQDPNDAPGKNKHYVKLNELHKRYKSLVVYGEPKNEKLKSLFSITQKSESKLRPNVIEIAKSKVKLLKNIPNLVNIEDFMSTKYAYIRNIATAYMLEIEVPYLQSLYDLDNLEKISKNLSYTINTLNIFRNKYIKGYLTEKNRELYQDIYDLSKENGYFNLKIKSLFDSNKEELKNASLLIHFSTREYSRNIIKEETLNLVTDYVLTKKLFKPNLEAVQKLRKETVFNIKPIENEDHSIKEPSDSHN
jgi:hypothetical protein